ncbi:hypothetical protein SPHV1_280047 [Novosphingobium sp. KN65.2]|nr:hypothetical protein SPHV1_280047 [Novosphingobium sp. KN65.2]
MPRLRGAGVPFVFSASRAVLRRSVTKQGALLNAPNPLKFAIFCLIRWLGIGGASLGDLAPIARLELLLARDFRHGGRDAACAPIIQFSVPL